MPEKKTMGVSITRLSSRDCAVHVNTTEEKANPVYKNRLTPSARRAFENSDPIVADFFSGRPMAILRSHYGLKQHELEQLLRERTRGVA